MILPPKKCAGDKILATDWNKIVDFLKSLILRGDGKSVRINHTPHGSTINIVNNPTPTASSSGGGGSAVYDGYFQIENVKKDPDNPDDVAKITVHHGKNGDSFLTAKMQINQSIIDLPTKENLATQAGYLYLAATADSYNHVTLEYLLDNNINFEEDKVKILIGKFTSQDDKFIFQRCYYGGFAQFLTLGDCSK